MLKRIGIVFFISLFLISCGQQSALKKREKTANNANKDNIIIGFAYPKERVDGQSLKEGVSLAMEQVNAKGGIDGRKIQLIERDDEDSTDQSLLIAQDFSKDYRMHLAITHISSHAAVPAAATYEFSNIIMMNPSATSLRLIKPSYKNIFRIIPNNELMGSYLANYARQQGYKNIIIYYARTEYGRDLANAFEKYAKIMGLNIVDRYSYLQQLNSYSIALENWKILHKFDAIFLAGTVPEAAIIVKQARYLNINVPIFGADALNSDALIDIAGKAAEGVVALTTFSPNKPTPIVQQFTQEFYKKFGINPNQISALGYDSFKLLAYGIESTHSEDATKIATFFRQMKLWEGVDGAIVFDKTGDLKDNGNLSKVIVKDGKFQDYL
ncbi:MAG: hypothetical protein A3C55_01350 [Gammaproteobacteria bacterium RIFCSPHIGHO2_02_FULL_42_13]|nr:MAG: hypothetical protein A3C55_01350 [Gammaproteobacteria bacterium RIFCSPHIGHO2_02_FULL_42_13]OGT69113.1 MAG: hypothetical protein A3H43_03985 [Gammaproteobacteria bacterium RIFCSPLOWO2_02_FULL_42_9]